jgi:aldose 1-epimerase
MPAGRYLPLAPDGCPEGIVAAVDGTPLDFRAPRVLREAAAMPHPQLSIAKGLDHYLLLDATAAQDSLPRPVAHLRSPHSGLRLSVFSSEPGVQVYAGHGLTGQLPRDLGRGGWRWAPGDGLCLEPMGWPDAPNQTAAPCAWLAPGNACSGEIVYRFGHG